MKSVAFVSQLTSQFWKKRPSALPFLQHVQLLRKLTPFDNNITWQLVTVTIAARPCDKFESSILTKTVRFVSQLKSQFWVFDEGFWTIEETRKRDLYLKINFVNIIINFHTLLSLCRKFNSQNYQFLLSINDVYNMNYKIILKINEWIYKLQLFIVKVQYFFLTQIMCCNFVRNV